MTRTSRFRRRRPGHSYRPHLDVLEDRCLLAVFSVTTLADAGPGSLRQAILDANASPGDDAIPFEVTGTINLTSALPGLSTNISLQGPGANLLTVRRSQALFASPSYRIFMVVAGATVGISGLTITNGNDEGGGIHNAGTLTLNHSTVRDNFGGSGGYGGGIRNNGTLTLNHSTVSGNEVFEGDGGGIYNGGTLTLNYSTVSGNRGGDGFLAGGIANDGTLTLNNSTVSGNRGDFGGGITNGGTATVNNSTVSGNSGRRGGGIITGGTGRFSARNTIIAGNTAPAAPDVSGPLGSLGHNLIGDSSGGSGFHETDLLDVDPMLGPLEDNGGPTWTHALLPGSPALDAGDNADAPETDQRGLPRVVGGTIDIGAFEVQVGPVASFFLFPVVATAPADVPVDLYVVALDAYGHLVTDYQGTVYLVSTDPAVPPVSYTFRPEDGGIAHLEDAVTFHTPGPQLLLAIDATFTAIGLGLYEVM